MTRPIKIHLADSEIPRQWYNIQADLPNPLQPPLGKDGKPIGPDALAPVFPMNLIEQEMCTQRWVDIPEGVLEKLLLWRPSPLCRAVNFEKALGTPAKIYYKFEGNAPGYISRDLRECSDIVSMLDAKMLSLNEAILEAKAAQEAELLREEKNRADKEK